MSKQRRADPGVAAGPLQLETMRLDDLIPYARNSRTHSEAQVQQIAASIREFGFTAPVLIDAAGGIIAGRGRVRAAQLLGMDDVPCIRLRHLSDAQRRALVIADNRTALNAGWDYQLLIDEMRALDAPGDFDLSVLGFTDKVLAALTASIGHEVPEASARQIDPSSYAFQLRCQACGFEFNLRKKARPG